MKVLILCAGLGSRLASLTKEKPKCLVKLNSTSILERLLNQLAECGLQRDNVFLGCGYKSELLPKGYKKFKNLEFRTTNMMKTTIIGIEGVMSFIEENENLLIIYGDCIYSNSFIKELILKVDKLSKITIPVDLDWETKWSERYENIYADAETLEYDLSSNKLLSIGKRTFLKKNYMAQFMGIYVLPYDSISGYIASYKSLTESIKNKISTTEFFEKTKLINNFFVMPNNYDWTEVDTLDDLLYAEKLFF